MGLHTIFKAHIKVEFNNSGIQIKFGMAME